MMMMIKKQSVLIYFCLSVCPKLYMFGLMLFE